MYRMILDDFGYREELDCRSALLFRKLCRCKALCDPECLNNRIGREVTVFGLGRNLEKEMEERTVEGTLMAADGATELLMEEGMWPDIIVTDLDGDIESIIEANEEGALAIILAHGDNMQAVRKYVPQFSGMITPTSQSRPPRGLYNFGGFTDGDRAVVTARHFGAERIKLIGFDFEDPRPIEGKDLVIKRKKLRWARKIIVDMNPDDVELIFNE